MKSGKNRKAYSLTEIIVVIAIIAILSATGITLATSQIAKSRIIETTSFLQVIDNSLEDGIMNNTGFFELNEYDFSETTDSTLPADLQTDAEAFLHEMEDLHLTCTLDYSTMRKVDANGCVGFGIDIKDPMDSWNMPYRMFYMYEESADRFLIVICSAGPNNTYADGYETGYTAFIKNSATKPMQVDDDLVEIMISR